MAEGVATVINRAAREHVQYVEFMLTAGGSATPQLGMKLATKLETRDDFARMRETSCWPAA